VSRLAPAILGLVLLGFCTYSVITTWVYPKDAPLKGHCNAWLERPAARWLRLQGCVLDVDLAIVESAEGDFEKLVNRQKGLSLKPYPVPPNWVAAWLPVRTETLGTGLVRAAYRIDSPDLLKWINTLERASEREKERMWADPAVLRRFSRPGLLPGKAEKPQTEALQKAFGAAASANLLAVYAGDPPPPSAPTLGILSGLLGLGLLGFVVRKRSAAATPEQELTNINVSDVKLEIGALEELRAEERKGKRNKKID
jgi:hypothetical protein